MSDIKRIQLTTISDVKKNSSDLNILSPSSLSKTTRYEINVDLFEPNAKSFPEFNYKKLLHAVKKKHKKTIKTPPNGVSDPFEENDDDVERIAREFEKKYGGVNNSYSGGGKKSNRPKITTDLCDKGAGYDDNDSFIDNTEAYDELIPEEVDTVSGGFYINSGALEFKHLSNYERPEDAHKMPKPRKRILSTSSSSSESSNDNDDEADENNHESDITDNNITVLSKPKNNGHADKKVKVLNLTTSDEEKQSKQTPPPAKPITKDKDKKMKNKDKKDEVVTSTGTGNANINNNDNNSSVNSNTNANNNNSNNNNNVSNNASSDRDKQIKTTTVKDMLRAKRDSILGLKDSAVKGDNDVNDEESTNSSLSSSSSNEPQPQSNTVGTSNTAAPAIPKSPHTNTKDTIEISKPLVMQASMIKLPANVSADLIKSVEELKEISQKHTQNGAKTNFFDSKTMDVIMKIDTETRNGDSATRTSVFQYIEHLVPFTQKTIMGHIRKVRVQNEENKLTKYYNKLKSAVDLILPIATESYKEECQKINQIRSTMPSDDKTATNAPKMPRKRFPWNDNTRKLLFDLYTALKLSYNIVKPRKETVDSFIENYYKTKLIGLWPPGWMRLEELNKEIERRKLGVKKPKENKKPAEIVSQTVNSVNSTINSNNITGSNNNNNSQMTTGTNQGNIVVDAINNVTTKESNNNSSKSILSTNNAFTSSTKLPASHSSVTNSNVDKSNIAAISTSNSNQIYSKTDKTETNYDINKKSSSGNTSNQVSSASTINLTNSLTITPVKTTGSASTSKPLPSVENKVTITNVETSTTPNTTNHHSSFMSTVLKPDILKSSSKQSTSSINNSNLVSKGSSSSKQSSSSSNVISISSAGSTANATNMQSPPATSSAPIRKTSDYSINSIMSTATSSSTTGSNSLNLNSGHSNSYPSLKTSSSSMATSPFSVNEICNINNKVNETIENAIKSKTNSNNSNHHNTINSNSNHINNNLAHSDSVIKVRSVANMNSSIRGGDNTSSSRTISGAQTTTASIQSTATSLALNTKKSKKHVHNSDDDYDDGDSDSSDVEIVDVYQPKRSKATRDNDIEIVDVKYTSQQQQPYSQSSQHHQKNKNIMINKNKYNKNNYVEPKLNNYISNSNQKMTGALNAKKDDNAMNKLNHQNTSDNDLDVSQIMKDLKELQELQQPKYSAMHALDNNLALSKQNQHPTGYGKSLKDSADTNKKSTKNS